MPRSCASRASIISLTIPNFASSARSITGARRRAIRCRFRRASALSPDRRGKVRISRAAPFAQPLLARHLWRRALAAGRRRDEWRDELWRRALSLRYGEGRQSRLERRRKENPARHELPLSAFLRPQFPMGLPALSAGEPVAFPDRGRRDERARSVRASSVARGLRHPEVTRAAVFLRLERGGDFRQGKGADLQPLFLVNASLTQPRNATAVLTG